MVLHSRRFGLTSYVLDLCAFYSKKKKSVNERYSNEVNITAIQSIRKEQISLIFREQNTDFELDKTLFDYLELNFI